MTKKPNTDLFTLLPPPNQSGTNKALFTSVFNSFLSTKESYSVLGTVFSSTGTKKDSSITEETIERQSQQLQPIFRTLIGSEDFIYTWEDAVSELTRLGISVDDISNWGANPQFNWAPPIDLDKLIHYSDYYWVDNNSVTSTPQYITIRDELTTAISLLSVFQKSVTEIGPTVSMMNVTAIGNYIDIDVSSMYDSLFPVSSKLFISNTNSNMDGEELTIVSKSTNGGVLTLSVTHVLDVMPDTGIISIQHRVDEQQQIVDYYTNLPINQSTAQWIDGNKWVHKNEVQNFSTVKRALVPIIEFSSSLELNEWTVTEYIWKYRAINSLDWESNSSPHPCELHTIDSFIVSSNTLILDEKYGDLSEWVGNVVVNSVEYQLTSSEFKQINGIENTVLHLDTVVGISAGNTITPSITSNGDNFISSEEHWCYISVLSTKPAPHQIINHHNAIDIASPWIVGVDNEYRLNLTSQEFTNNNSAIYNLAVSLSAIALKRTNQIRVYVDGKRQIGSYVENGSNYVTGITFLPNHIPTTSQTVLIEIGVASIFDIGLHSVPVRTILNEDEYHIQGKSTVSLIKYHKLEQIKHQHNQYPMFDMYDITGAPLHEVSEIFSFALDSSSPTNPHLSLNVKVIDGEFVFNNHLFTGVLKCYLDYSSYSGDYWYAGDSVVSRVGDATTSRFLVGDVYTSVTPNSTPPTNPLVAQIWVDANNIHQYTASGVWEIIGDVDTNNTVHPSIHTIWKESLIPYVPQQKDWYNRTLSEYNIDRQNFINAKSVELGIAGVPNSELATTATELWLESQSNPHSHDGEWIGQYNIPDYVLHNISHNHVQEVEMRELIPHFLSIIQSQTAVPGYIGLLSDGYHLSNFGNIHWGSGGTIHEYKYPVDVLLSQLMVKGTTIYDIIVFARTQYDAVLRRTQDYFVDSIRSIINSGNLDNLSHQVITLSKEKLHHSTTLAKVYHDTTSGSPLTIMTLPYMDAALSDTPHTIIDSQTIVHHDGHIAKYAINQSDLSAIQRDLGAIEGGSIGNTLPTLISDLVTVYGGNNTPQIFYDLTSDNIYTFNAVMGQQPPTSPSLDNLWVDTSTDSLYQYKSSGWLLLGVTGSGSLSVGDISVWKVLNLNVLLVDTILSVEQDIYDGISSNNINKLENVLGDQFNSQISRIYDQTNPFTWNYKFSAPGEHYNIITSSSLGIVIEGTNNTFNPGDVIKVKNSTGLDGNHTISSISPAGGNTQLLVVGVLDETSTVGIVYTGDLPSSTNTGAETGSHFTSLYQDLYNTADPSHEPWKLQGYTSKPQWWDSEYRNNDKTVFGDRLWKHRQTLSVISIAATEVSIAGDISQIVHVGDVITTSSPNDTITIQNKSYDSVLDITTIQTTTPHSLTVGSSLNISIGMWFNIQTGLIPIGATYPTGETAITGNPASETLGVDIQLLPSFQFMSVNISDVDIVSGSHVYSPDSLLPPYLDISNFVAVNSPTMIMGSSTIFTDFVSEINLTSELPQIGDGSLDEWMWNHSPNYLYSKLSDTFRLHPLSSIPLLCNDDISIVNGLPVSEYYSNVISHDMALFHGDIQPPHNRYQVSGIRQWYVNFIRGGGSFHILDVWKKWTVELGYPLNALVSKADVQVLHDQLTITPDDYTIDLKRAVGATRLNLSSFDLNIQNIYNKIQYTLDLRGTNKNLLQFMAPAEYSCVLLDDKFIVGGNAITSIDVESNIITLDGIIDFSSDSINVINNTSTMFNIMSVEHENAETKLYIDGSIPVGLTGVVVDANFSCGWQTGQVVSLTTNGVLPIPLSSDVETYITQYFVIVDPSDGSITLANSRRDAINGLAIATSGGSGSHRIGAVLNIIDSISTRNIRQFESSGVISSMTFPYVTDDLQTIVNIIIGYGYWVDAQGWEVSNDSNKNWLTELQQVFDHTKSMLITPPNANKYAISQPIASKLEWPSGNQGIVTNLGTAVRFQSMTGVLPVGINYNQTYYTIPTSTGIYISLNQDDAFSGNYITITSGTGDLLIYQPAPLIPPVSIIINPYGDVIRINNESIDGMVGSLLYQSDAQIYQPALYGTDDRPISANHLMVYRNDEYTEIQLMDDIHESISGCSIEFCKYEHVVVLPKRLDRSVLFGDFFGLQISSIQMIFERSNQYDATPNIPGYFTSVDTNQNISLTPNFETGVNDIRYLYDTYTTHNTRLSSQARKSIGFSSNIINHLNVPDKSNFIFWRGMIQHKGSTNAIKAFVNAKQLISANVDEFWAIQKESFGSTFDNWSQSFSVCINPSDVYNNSTRLRFVESDNTCYPGFGSTQYSVCGYAFPEVGTSTISGQNSDNFIVVSPDNLDRNCSDHFNTTNYLSMAPKEIGSVTIEPAAVGYDILLNDEMISSWDGASSLFIPHLYSTDLINIVVCMYPEGTKEFIRNVSGTSITLNIGFIPLTDSISVYKNGHKMEELVEYIQEIATGQLLSTKLLMSVPLTSDDVLEILHTPASLALNTHFKQINTKVVELLYTELLVNSESVQIVGSEVDLLTNNPLRVINNSDGSIASTVSLWDPARGIMTQRAFGNLDVISKNDPAVYTNTASVTSSQQTWGVTEVGLIWCDKNDLEYTHYYDDKVFNLYERENLWGELAGWVHKEEGITNIRVFQWVESDVHPSEWNGLVPKEESEDIPANIRKSGLVEKIVFIETSVGIWEPIRSKYEEIIIAINVSSAVINVFDIGDVVDVYKNGVLHTKDFVLTSLIYDTTTFAAADTIRLVENIDFSQTNIDANVDSGLWKYEYSYSKIDSLSKYDILEHKYYFWVSNRKVVMPNKTLSTEQISKQLKTPQTPYFFGQEPLSSQKISTSDGDISYQRQWTHVISNNDMSRFSSYNVYDDPIHLNRQIFSLGTQVKDNALENVTVLVNGEPVPFVLLSTGREIQVTPILLLDDIVSITYQTMFKTQTESLPNRATTAVVRGLIGVVTRASQFSLQFNSNHLLVSKNQLDTLQHKNMHTHWELIRQHQQSQIPHYLWNKVTESIIGYKIANINIVVPSLRLREFDAITGKTTRFGLDDEQSFVDGDYARSSVMSYITSETVDFGGINIIDFITTYDMDSNVGMQEAMDIIYNTFGAKHVNAIFFSVLHDALASGDKYKGILKTSLISLSGVQSLYQQ